MGVSLFLPIADAAPCERPSGFLSFGQAGLSEVGRLGGNREECKNYWQSQKHLIARVNDTRPINSTVADTDSAWRRLCGIHFGICRPSKVSHRLGCLLQNDNFFAVRFRNFLPELACQLDCRKRDRRSCCYSRGRSVERDPSTLVYQNFENNRHSFKRSADCLVIHFSRSRALFYASCGNFGRWVVLKLRRSQSIYPLTKRTCGFWH